MGYDNANLADPRTPLLWGDSVHIKVPLCKFWNLLILSTENNLI